MSAAVSLQTWQPRVGVAARMVKMRGVIGPAVTLALLPGVGAVPQFASVQPHIPEGHVMIRGPGLERPLGLAGQPFFDLVYLAGLVPDWAPSPPGRRVPPPTSARLGPAYDVFYSFPSAGRGPVPLVQTLYFGATDREEVWIHTLSGQGIPLAGERRLDVPEGWWQSPVLDDFLRAVALAEGITAFPPPGVHAAGGGFASPTVPSRSGDPVSAGGPPRTATRSLLGLAAIGLLLILGALSSRPARGRGAGRPISMRI
jgi:hypothetical protein